MRLVQREEEEEGGAGTECLVQGCSCTLDLDTVYMLLGFNTNSMCGYFAPNRHL